MNWTRPHDLEVQLEKVWQSGDILRARVVGETLFPLTLRLRRPTTRELNDNFSDVADWVNVLRAGQTAGYRIEWQERRNRVHGVNDIPGTVVVETEQDALRWLGRQKAAAAFSRLSSDTLAVFPQLRDWLGQRPLKVLEHESVWADILAVLRWFEGHPRPGIYLRELDIPGVHTKFIETHRGILAELLNLVLPQAVIDETATGLRGFNRRYGLRDKPLRVRFRMLDPELAIAGLTDLTVNVAELAQLQPEVNTVFVAENEINGLAFPPMPKAMVFFGLGYAVDALQFIPWVADKTIYYWGDIDTHGFAILNRFREYFPEARSMLMDRHTFESHRAAWGREPKSKRFVGRLAHLTKAENALYQQLRGNAAGDGARLEQEHISQRSLLEALERLYCQVER